jgi:hypothetical protein
MPIFSLGKCYFIPLDKTVGEFVVLRLIAFRNTICPLKVGTQRCLIKEKQKKRKESISVAYCFLLLLVYAYAPMAIMTMTITATAA